MSQSHNPRDNQALLQSMLQRLKLQTGTTNVQSGQYATVGQNAQSETSAVQTVNNNAINGFEPTDNVKREFAVNGEIQVFDRSSEHSETLGQRKEHGQDSLSQTGQLSPKPVKDTATIFSEGNESFINFETKKDISSDLNTGGSSEQTQDQNSSFVPRVYAWSLNSTGTNSAGGVFGATGQTTQTVSSSQNTTNNRKQRSSEKKTQRWTQKIKAKWRERPGSFGKKDKEYRQGAEETIHENPPQYQPLKTEETRGTPASIDSTDHTKSHTQAADGNEEYMRTTTDFDLGLGSFSLLDEIVSGQEWAKFLNPTIPVSVPERQDHKSSQENMNHQLINHLNSNSGINSMSQEPGKSLWMFGMSREAPTTDIAMTQTSPEASLPGMDITEMKQIQSEPMDHGQSQSDMQITVNEPQLQLQRAAKAEPANTVENSSLKGRSSLSRKRQYQLTDRIETTSQRDISNGNETADDGSVFLPDNHAVDRIDGLHGKIMPSSSSSPSPCSPAPRGVLKQSLSRNSESSTETVIKKRRVEENRRVRFSEEIITIDPPELGPDVTDSEDSEEEDSFIEEDSEEQADVSMLGPVRQEEVAPARRPALPAWIRALKRKNTGKKPR